MSKTIWMGLLSLFAVAAFIGIGASALRASAPSDQAVTPATTCGCANKANCQSQGDCGCGCNGGGGGGCGASN